MDTLWLLYGLSDPDGSIRYVGITKGNLRGRYRAHLHGKKTPAKRAWIEELRARQEIPRLLVFGSIRGTQLMAVDAEVTLSRCLVAQGAQLLNREVGFGR